MTKHLAKECLYQLPSGNLVHPCRLIVRDGTLMWKHALLSFNKFTSLPETQAHEQHIIKTAQRLEELNMWVSQELEPWQSFVPCAWYNPENPNLAEGISVYFQHNLHPAKFVYESIIDKIQPHEQLECVDIGSTRSVLYFKRC